jgi:hypothetical protein
MPTPTACSRVRPRGSTGATARSRNRSRTAPCSGPCRPGIETLGGGRCGSPARARHRAQARRYQLGYLDVAPHAAVNGSVGLVRAARLERAVPFTNAVMRRLSDGLRGLLEALPEGPLKHSYPDWIYETWVRDWGKEEALELMRVQNEPPETVVRLVRGEIRGEPTDVPGAWRVERVDDLALAEGRIWPQSRGSQLAGLAVGSREGACSTSAPRLGRRPCSPERSLRSSSTRVGRGAGGKRTPPRRDYVRVVTTGSHCRRSSRAATAPRRRAVPSRRPRRPPDPRWARNPCRSASSRCPPAAER